MLVWSEIELNLRIGIDNFNEDKLGKFYNIMMLIINVNHIQFWDLDIFHYDRVMTTFDFGY